MSRKKSTTDDPLSFFMEWGIDVASSTVILEDSIDKDAASKIRHAFCVFPRGRPVTVILNTDGGDEIQGMAIYDMIRSHPEPVTVRVVGEACSMGALILQAGDVRQLAKNSIVMTHVGTWEVPAQHAKNAVKYMKFVERYTDRLDEIMVKRVKDKKPDMTLKKWKEHDLWDNYMLAEEAIEWGLADEIWEPA